MLLSPLRFANGRMAPNRVWLAPMTNLQSHADGALADDELRWLERRAEGGFGVIESCATHVSLDGRGWVGQFGIDDDARIDEWRRVAEALHVHGSLLIPQIFHAGERAAAAANGVPAWSASADEAKGVVAGTEQQIEAVIEAFRAAAVRAERAGADGVELHGAHGYLLCQFLSATGNRRTDAWGGSLENRARLLRTTLAAVRGAVGRDFIVGVRLSPEDFGATKGLDLDESVQVAQWMAEDGADFLHISLWDATKNTQKYPQTHANRVFRDALPDAVPLVTAGNIWTRDDADAQLALGADAVALGRSAIANPAWPQTVGRDGTAPDRPPLSRQALRDRGLGEAFVTYMARWPGFVQDA
jgi:2,4-dienoyl-CoA reductase-like NADH-dependent reductase (Old Yellow Enzyme family)